MKLVKRKKKKVLFVILQRNNFSNITPTKFISTNQSHVTNVNFKHILDNLHFHGEIKNELNNK